MLSLAEGVFAGGDVTAALGAADPCRGLDTGRTAVFGDWLFCGGVAAAFSGPPPMWRIATHTTTTNTIVTMIPSRFFQEVPLETAVPVPLRVMAVPP
jgi:hypothetical protein